MRRLIFEPEHDDFRESVRGFLTKEWLPHTEEWEEAGIIDRSAWKKAAAQGLVGFQAPEELGGAGLNDFRFNAVIGEEVARLGAVSDQFQMVDDIVLPYFLEYGTQEQLKRWMPRMTTGDLVPAIAMSEPGTGSDLRGIATTATWSGDHYRVSGSKTFVTSGIQCDLVLVAAQVRRDGIEGLGLFVLESTMDGFQRGRKLTKIGRRAQDTAELFFDDVRVEPGNVLGEVGHGMTMLKRNLPQERLAIAINAVAAAERALELGLQYAKDRRAFGRPVGTFQANRFRLAELATELEVARAYTDRCILAHVAGELTAAEAAGAKFWTTEMQARVVDTALQLHGGYGYMEEYEIARLWRDARVQRIYGGTNEIMRDIVGRSLDLA